MFAASTDPGAATGPASDSAHQLGSMACCREGGDGDDEHWDDGVDGTAAPARRSERRCDQRAQRGSRRHPRARPMDFSRHSIRIYYYFTFYYVGVKKLIVPLLFCLLKFIPCGMRAQSAWAPRAVRRRRSTAGYVTRHRRCWISDNFNLNLSFFSHCIQYIR